VRIIAGEFRGRRLLGPADSATRPITDRVKQSIFDILAPRLGGAVVYDVFAGTGSFGLEALSRGARECVFFEKHRPAVERLRRNIETLGIADRCRVEARDLFKIDVTPLPRPAVIFFDPPYPMLTGNADALRERLKTLAGHLEPEGIISFRQDAAVEFDVGCLRVIDERTWSSMRLRVLTSFR
jgi:16S rRNA (guanine966-N2)-methyltransferase